MVTAVESVKVSEIVHVRHHMHVCNNNSGLTIFLARKVTVTMIKIVERTYIVTKDLVDMS